MVHDPSLLKPAAEIGRRLTQRHESLVLAESVTGGWIGAMLTSIPGSSKWFEGAFVAYQTGAKQRWLGIPSADLAGDGAVSEAVARWMLRGAFAAADADWALATTGYAGSRLGCDPRVARAPQAFHPEEPTGLVYIGWGRRGPANLLELIRRYRFSGNRESIRHATVRMALAGLLEQLDG